MLNSAFFVAPSRFFDTAGNLIRTGYKKNKVCHKVAILEHNIQKRRTLSSLDIIILCESANWLDFYISLSELKNSWSGIGKLVTVLECSNDISLQQIAQVFMVLFVFLERWKYNLKSV